MTYPVGKLESADLVIKGEIPDINLTFANEVASRFPVQFPIIVCCDKEPSIMIFLIHLITGSDRKSISMTFKTPSLCISLYEGLSQITARLWN